MNDPVTAVTEVTDIQTQAGALLDEVKAYLEQFIAYPDDHASVAHTLWIVHAHLPDAFDNTPRLAVLSPEPGSGKSRLLELTECLVPRPVLSVNASVAYVFRKISDPAGLPCLLMDEVDAVFSAKKADGNEDLRGLLNSGYRRGATAGRAAVRGKEVVTEEWPSYCAVAMAGLGNLPDTIMTRSIVIPMKRRRPDQKVMPFRRRANESDAHALRDSIADLAATIRSEVSDAWPDLPDGIEDRNADIWEPLIAIADAVGGYWPSDARNTAVAMVNQSKNKPATLGIRLLSDVRMVLGGDDRVSTADLLARLHGIDEAPWGNLRGEAIDARFLASKLKTYDIETNKTLKIGGVAVKGYYRYQFADAFDRYLPAPAESDTGNSGNQGNREPCARHPKTPRPDICFECEAVEAA